MASWKVGSSAPTSPDGPGQPQGAAGHVPSSSSLGSMNGSAPPHRTRLGSVVDHLQLKFLPRLDVPVEQQLADLKAAHPTTCGSDASCCFCCGAGCLHSSVDDELNCLVSVEPKLTEHIWFAASRLQVKERLMLQSPSFRSLPAVASGPKVPSSKVGGTPEIEAADLSTVQTAASTSSGLSLLHENPDQNNSGNSTANAKTAEDTEMVTLNINHPNSLKGSPFIDSPLSSSLPAPRTHAFTVASTPSQHTSKLAGAPASRAQSSAKKAEAKPVQEPDLFTDSSASLESALVPNGQLSSFTWVRQGLLFPRANFLCIPQRARRTFIRACFAPISVIAVSSIAFTAMRPLAFPFGLLSLFCLILTLPQIDSFLARTNALHFQFWYVLFELTLFVATATAGQLSASSSPSDVLYAIGFILVFSVHGLLALWIDAFHASIRTRILKVITCVIFVIYIFYLIVTDLFFDSPFDPRSFWFVYWSDTRRIAMSGVIQFLLFILRYVTHIFRSAVSSEVTLATVRLPLLASIFTVPKEEAASFYSLTDESGTIARNSDSDLTLVRIRTENISLFLTSIHNPDEGTTQRSFRFRPAYTNAFIQRIANKPAYQISFLLFLFVVIVGLFFNIFGNVSGYILLLIGCSYGIFELVRFDRTLMYTLVFTFEWWLVIAAAVQYTVFGIWWRMLSADAQWSIPFYLMFLVSAVFVISFDAAPAYSNRFRISLLCLLFFNCIRIFVVDYIYRDRYADKDVCFYMCSPARYLAYSGVATYAVFLAKFIVSVIRYPKRCMLLSTGLKVSESQSLKDPTALYAAQRQARSASIAVTASRAF